MALSALASTMMRLPADQLVVIQQRFSEVEGGLELAQFVALMLEVISSDDDDESMVLRTVGDLCELFAQIDVNGDGTMEWEEFTGFLVEQAAAIDTAGITEVYKHLETLSLQEPASKLTVQCARWIPQLNSMLVALGQTIHFLEADVTAACGVVTKLELPLRDVAADNDDDPEAPGQEALHATALHFEYIEAVDVIAVLRSDAYVEFIKLYSRTAINTETAVFAGMTRLDKVHRKLAWNALGNKFLSLSNDFDVHVWDLMRDPNSGLYGLGSRDPLRGHTDYVKDMLVAVTEEYRYVVSAGLDHKVYLWDALSGELKNERTANGSSFSCLAFDASNNILLAATYHFHIVVWDISSELNRPLYHLTGHSAQVMQMITFPGSHRCASLDESGEFIWWDTQRLQLNDANRFVHSFRTLDRCEALTAIVGASASTKSFNNVILAGAGKKMHLFTCEDTRPPEGPPLAVLYNPIFAVILTIHADDVKIWDATKGSLQKVIHKPTDSSITCATFDDRLRKLLLCDQDGGVHVLNFLNGALMKSLPPMPERPSQMIYVEVDKMVIVASWCGWLRIYDEDCELEGSIVRQVRAHKHDITSMTFSRAQSLVVTGDCKGLVRVWDFQLLTLLCECYFGDGAAREITSVMFLHPWPLLAIADSHGKIALASITHSRKLEMVGRAGPALSGADFPSAQQRKFESESGAADYTQQAVVCMTTHHQADGAPPAILIAGDEYGAIRSWSFAALLKNLDIQPISGEQSIAADAAYAPRRRRILHNIIGPAQRLDLSVSSNASLGIVGIWQCHQNVMTSLCSTSNPAMLITAGLDEAVKLWSFSSDLQGILTRGRELDSVFRRAWHFPIDFSVRKALLDEQAQQVFAAVLELQQAAEKQAGLDEKSFTSSVHSLEPGSRGGDSFWLTSGGSDRVLNQLSGHRTWVPSKRELAAEYTKARLKQMLRTTSKMLGDKKPRQRRKGRRAKSEGWDFFADFAPLDDSLSLSGKPDAQRRQHRASEDDRVLDRVYSQDPNSWEVGSVNKTRLMYRHLSQEYDMFGGWSVDRNAARELRMMGHLDELLQPSEFLSDRMPCLTHSLSSLRADLESHKSVAWTAMQKISSKKSKRRKVKLHSRSSVVKRRVVLSPIDTRVEEHVVWDLTSDVLGAPLHSPLQTDQSPGSQDWRRKVKWILKKANGVTHFDASFSLSQQPSFSTLSSTSGEYFADLASFDDLGDPDEWDESSRTELRERTHFGMYKIGELLALQKVCRYLDVNKHSVSKTVAEACNVRVNLLALIKHDFVQNRPQFRQSLRRRYYTTDSPPTHVPFSELLHCLLPTLHEDEMWELHKYFMLLECEHRKKHAEYGNDQEDVLRRLFDMYDLDKNGSIDLDELVQGLGENRDFSVDSFIPAEVLMRIMDSVDADSNRQLDYEEFRNIFTEAFEVS